jgi:hypothetical protein
MNNENKRIPFDWEKYQSGEYQVVCRDGSIPEQITYYPNSIDNYKITALCSGVIRTFTVNGYWDKINNPTSRDLLLIPKPKKFQAWVNCYDNGNITYHLIESESKEYKNMLAIKGIECVETRLIEWKG